MRLTTLACLLLSAGLAGLGALSLRYDDFALAWQPVPDGLPPALRAVLAYASGALLLAGGVGLFLPTLRLRAKAALMLTLFVASWLVLLQVPRVAQHPGTEFMWLGFGENLLLVTGAWVLWIALAGETGGGKGGLSLARLLFGLALPLIGLSHFTYTDATAGMVPAWLPVHRAFAYLTGAGHIAAGLGIVLGVAPRLAATLEAAMISCFVLLLHVPGMLHAPGDRMQWTMLCIATAYAGAAWAVAASYAGQPWFRLGWSVPRAAAASATV